MFGFTMCEISICSRSRSCVCMAMCRVFPTLWYNSCIEDDRPPCGVRGGVHHQRWALAPCPNPPVADSSSTLAYISQYSSFSWELELEHMMARTGTQSANGASNTVQVVAADSVILEIQKACVHGTCRVFPAICIEDGRPPCSARGGVHHQHWHPAPTLRWLILHRLWHTANFAKHQGNPKVGPIAAKMMSKVSASWRTVPIRSGDVRFCDQQDKKTLLLF